MLEMNHEKMWKRLLAAMQLGIALVEDSGHVWVWTTEIDYSFDELLRKNKILFNDKIYGGVLEALDTIDASLKMMGEGTLLERYETDKMPFLGDKVGPDMSRINVVKVGDGGLC